MTTEAPREDWYQYFRKPEAGRGFAVALLVSAIFHLSMVTVFRIVTYIPREDIRFTEFTIVSVTPEAEPWPVVDVLAPVGGAGPQLALRGLAGADSGVQLPTIEFAELDRLRVREESDPEPIRPEPLFREPSDDSWARFSRGLSNMSRSITQLRLSGAPGVVEPSPLPMEETPAPRPASRPAEGFEAYVVWAGAPTDRKLLFAPPIEALWDIDPAEFTQPIEMVLQVNPLGRVVNVFSPNLDARELVDAVQLSALQYRFEPLEVGDGANQTATLRVQREARGQSR
ncbi:MAG: hypothetical protein JNK74_05770 [Candidatus Hydrogenedentes bacterium]|nr:hypothetical protein [Candidatus Hydrogenedentota bacterium]